MLEQLQAAREGLIKAINALEVPLEEGRGYMDKRVIKSSESAINSLKRELEALDQHIQEHIKRDEKLSQQYKVVSSVHGVGKVLATELIIITNEFKRFSSTKQLACYAGIAPFEHSSGSSIRGKTRVSCLANMCLKSLFHMAALACLRKGNELHEFYQKKVAQGKAKMAVINAVRNKIILRIFDCVRDNRFYEKNYPKSLA